MEKSLDQLRASSGSYFKTSIKANLHTNLPSL